MSDIHTCLQHVTESAMRDGRFVKVTKCVEYSLQAPSPLLPKWTQLGLLSCFRNLQGGGHASIGFPVAVASARELVHRTTRTYTRLRRRAKITGSGFRPASPNQLKKVSLFQAPLSHNSFRLSRYPRQAISQPHPFIVPKGIVSTQDWLWFPIASG